jgi:hypothetical protein
MSKKERKYTATYSDTDKPDVSQTTGSPVSVNLKNVHSKEELLGELKKALSERSRLHGFIPVDRIHIHSYNEYHCRKALAEHLDAACMGLATSR